MTIKPDNRKIFDASWIKERKRKKKEKNSLRGKYNCLDFSLNMNTCVLVYKHCQGLCNVDITGDKESAVSSCKYPFSAVTTEKYF